MLNITGSGIIKTENILAFTSCDATTNHHLENSLLKFTLGSWHYDSSEQNNSIPANMATAPPWKEAASIIIATRRSLKDIVTNANLADFPLAHTTKNSPNHSRYDYRILMLKRSLLSSFMANAYVFPGGMLELSDYSLRWWDVFRNAGIRREEVSEFSDSISGPRPPIFCNSLTLSNGNVSSDECFPPHIAVRISAIRETYEETGILLLTNSDLKDKNEVSSYTSCDIDFKTWREKVHKNPNAFLDLCLELKACPNIWGIHEWWNWLTPTNVGHRRYDVMFYVCCLSKMPEAQADQSEITSLKWCTPEEMLEENYSGNVFLAPPQIYELSRFLSFHHFEDLRRFSKQREDKGVERWMPIMGSATDGAVSLLPGDDLYSEKPDLEGINPPLDFPFTIDELRNRSHSLNRLELIGIIGTIYSNTTPPCSHVQPTRLPSIAPVFQSFL